MSGKDQISEDGAVELDEDELGQAEGGTKFEGPSLKWKVNGFDGKGNDVVTEEITIVHEYIKR